MKTHRLSLLAFLLLPHLVATRVLADPPPILIDFQPDPNVPILIGTEIKSQYSLKDVCFLPSDQVIFPDPKLAGNTVLNALSAEFTPPARVRFYFNSPRTSVSLQGGVMEIPPGLVFGVLHAVSMENGVNVDYYDGPWQLDTNGFETPFTIVRPSATISDVDFREYYQLHPNDGHEIALGAAIDNLSFTGPALPSPPNGPPIIVMTAPTDLERLTGDLNKQTAPPTMPSLVTPLTGVVVSEQLLPDAQHGGPTVDVAINPRQLPRGLFGSGLATLSLTGAPNTYQFGDAITLRPGQYTISVTATNVLASSTKTIDISYEPQFFIDRKAVVAAQGTDLGNFVYYVDQWNTPSNARLGDCEVALYDFGAIAKQPRTANALVISGDAYVEWRRLMETHYAHNNDASQLGVLGCPEGSLAAHPTVPGVQVQSFAYGDIYVQNQHAYFVPGYFREALAGMAAIDGQSYLPVADPSRAISLQSRLYQQFIRYNVDTIPVTLEIRGSPPTLFIARQGGDLHDLSVTKAWVPKAQNLSNAIPTRTYTLWESFPCPFFG